MKWFAPSAGDAAEQNAEVNAGGNAAAFANFNGDEADVVGVCDYRDSAAVVEGDVELAWEFVHIARVGDVGLERFCNRRDVEEFLGI